MAKLEVTGLLLAINGPLTNQDPVNLSLAKKMTKLKKENSAPGADEFRELDVFYASGFLVDFIGHFFDEEKKGQEKSRQRKGCRAD